MMMVVMITKVVTGKGLSKYLSHETTRNPSQQCTKIIILPGCRSGKLSAQKDGQSGIFEGKCGMN